MLTRRHIRVKVMQSIYAFTQSQEDSLEKQERFLRVSIENMYSLYLLVLNLFVEVQQMADNNVKISSKKYLKTASDSYPDKGKFINNKLILQIVNNKALKEEISRRKLQNWYINEEYVRIIYKEIIESSIYEEYMATPENSYEQDRTLLINLFRNIVAPNEKIYDYLEDDKLTWVDDIPIINTFILKQFKKVEENSVESFFLPALLKDEEDMDFAKKIAYQDFIEQCFFSGGNRRKDA